MTYSSAQTIESITWHYMSCDYLNGSQLQQHRARLRCRECEGDTIRSLAAELPQPALAGDQ